MKRNGGRKGKLEKEKRERWKLKGMCQDVPRKMVQFKCKRQTHLPFTNLESRKDTKRLLDTTG